MDDEFKLCWKNFQDNIASGFQNLYDRGDLVDVTLACDGKLLHAHKIVLAICSPYFQEIFTTNPCKHPIIILKDVTFNIMCELLEFMYQGVVNVKHTELQSFMKIGQLLQIKGLATSPSTNAEKPAASETSHIAGDEVQLGTSAENVGSNANAKISHPNDAVPNIASDACPPNTSHIHKATISNLNMAVAGLRGAPSPILSPSSAGSGGCSSAPLSQAPSSNLSLHHTYQAHSGAAGKRHHSEFGGSSNASGGDALSIYARKQLRRSLPLADSANEGNDGSSEEQGSNDDFFMPSVPHIAMAESRYEAHSGKRDSLSGSGAGSEAHQQQHHQHHHHHNLTSPIGAGLRNAYVPAFNFDYSLYKNSGSVGGGGGGGSGSSSVGSVGASSNITGMGAGSNSGAEYPNELHMSNDYKGFGNHVDIPPIAPGEHWFQGKLEFMLSQRGKPLLVHDGHTFGIQYVRKDKKYWQCNLSRKFNCKARVTTTENGEIIVTNNEHCHTEIRQHLRKDYQRNKVLMNAFLNLGSMQRQYAIQAAAQSVGGGVGNGSGTGHALADVAAVAAAAAAATAVRAEPPAVSPPALCIVEQETGLDLGMTPAPTAASSCASPSRRARTTSSSARSIIVSVGRDTTSPPPAHQNVVTSPPPALLEEQEMPLDCGIRTAAERALHSLSEAQGSSVGNNADNNNSIHKMSAHDWKCKEISDLQ